MYHNPPSNKVPATAVAEAANLNMNLLDSDEEYDGIAIRLRQMR